MPFDAITIPPGLRDFVFSGWSSSSGDESTSMGMGILINGVNKFSYTNQTIWGPAALIISSTTARSRRSVWPRRQTALINTACRRPNVFEERDDGGVAHRAWAADPLGLAEAEMSAHLNHRKLARLLETMGGLYTVSDILARSPRAGCRASSRATVGLSLRLSQFPRARLLEILIALGEHRSSAACSIETDRQYARDNGIGLVQAYGRRGWFQHPLTEGWKIRTNTFLYQREL